MSADSKYVYSTLVRARRQPFIACEFPIAKWSAWPVTRTFAAPHPGDPPGHSGHSGSSGDRGQEYGGESDRAIDRQSGPGRCGFSREDQGGGGCASRFFHLWLAARSGCGDGPAFVGGVWLATRALGQRRGSANVHGDRAGDGEQREKAVGPFPLGPREVSAPKFSRMGRSLHRALGVGTKLLPATTQPGPGPPCGGASVGLQMDSRISLLERRGCL